MAQFEIRIEGWREVAKRLRDLGGKLERKVLRQATRAAAKPVLSAARRALQSDNSPDYRDTGALMRSIRIRAMKRKKGRVGVSVATGAGWFKGPTFYGAFREFGHKIGKRANNESLGLRAGKRRSSFEKAAAGAANAARKEVRPYPFIGRAYEEQKQAAAAIMEREILAGIHREANQR